MTQTSPIGRRVRGTHRELAMLTAERALDRKRLPASLLLNDIARDALAAICRNDAEAIINLPTSVQFRAHVANSTLDGRWRLIIIARAHGAWGHCKSGAMGDRASVVAMAEMINGPTGPSLTNRAEHKPLARVVSTQCDRLDVLAALYVAHSWRHIARAPRPSAAAEASTARRRRRHDNKAAA